MNPMDAFTKIEPLDFLTKPAYLIGKQWMLITAENASGETNTMTAAWGGLGWLWEKPVAYVFIRPERFTKEFVDEAQTFSLSFLDESHRRTLGYLGKVSGRDEDKIKKSGLVLAHEENTPYFAESEVVMFCRKLYRQRLTPESFIDKTIEPAHYAAQGYHDLYIVEVEKIFSRTGAKNC